MQEILIQNHYEKRVCVACSIFPPFCFDFVVREPAWIDFIILVWWNNQKNKIYLDYDTDEETDKLLGVEHRINAKHQAIRDAVC